MLSRILPVGLTLLAVSVSLHSVRGKADDQQATPQGLPGGWKTIKEIPDPDGGGKLTVWVEQGWLVARRETKSGDLEWYIVLARATDAQPPRVQIDETTCALSIRYGPHFVREYWGQLRVLREGKDDKSPAWPPPPPTDPKEKTQFTAGGKTVLAVSGDWYWVASGPSTKKPDVRIRLQHAQLGGDRQGVEAFRFGPAHVWCGRATLQDEGDLLVASRNPIPAAEAELLVRKGKKELFEKPAPALAARQWLNVTEELALEKLKGKVVLLDFWGQWCPPCVKKLPVVEELHTRFKDRGLVVIGVHSANDSEKLEEFLKAKNVSFPVMIDRGETAKRYFIDSWPTYFLIDKAGKAAWGFANEPPTAAHIEELLGR